MTIENALRRKITGMNHPSYFFFKFDKFFGNHLRDKCYFMLLSSTYLLSYVKTRPFSSEQIEKLVSGLQSVTPPSEAIQDMPITDKRFSYSDIPPFDMEIFQQFYPIILDIQLALFSGAPDRLEIASNRVPAEKRAIVLKNARLLALYPFEANRGEKGYYLFYRDAELANSLPAFEALVSQEYPDSNSDSGVSTSVTSSAGIDLFNHLRILACHKNLDDLGPSRLFTSLVAMQASGCTYKALRQAKAETEIRRLASELEASISSLDSDDSMFPVGVVIPELLRFMNKSL